jgi:hypothetical protein
MVAIVGGLAVLADDTSGPDRRRNAPVAEPRKADAWNAPPFAAREEAALGFVRTHYSELAALVEQLKSMQPDEYERAIGELYQVDRNLASLKKQAGDRRYEAALDAWKAKSKVQVLTAQLVSSSSTELEEQLREAVGRQLDAQLQVQRLERETLENRLQKVSQDIDRLEKTRDELITTRFQGLVKKAQRARPRDGGNPATATRAGAKGKTKP